MRCYFNSTVLPGSKCRLSARPIFRGCSKSTLKTQSHSTVLTEVSRTSEARYWLEIERIDLKLKTKKNAFPMWVAAVWMRREDCPLETPKQMPSQQIRALATFECSSASGRVFHSSLQRTVSFKSLIVFISRGIKIWTIPRMLFRLRLPEKNNCRFVFVDNSSIDFLQLSLYCLIGILFKPQYCNSSKWPSFCISTRQVNSRN